MSSAPASNLHRLKILSFGKGLGRFLSYYIYTWSTYGGFNSVKRYKIHNEKEK